jgi:hypothetical protein
MISTYLPLAKQKSFGTSTTSSRIALTTTTPVSIREFAFAFFDTYGDGLLAAGKIKLTFKGDVIFNGGNFGRDHIVRLCNE